MALVRTTFEVVTPESAELGDAEERGWVDEVGTTYTFRELVNMLRNCEPSSSQFHKGIWYSITEQSYVTGNHITYSYHIKAPENFQRRLFKYLTKKS